MVADTNITPNPTMVTLLAAASTAWLILELAPPITVVQTDSASPWLKPDQTWIMGAPASIKTSLIDKVSVRPEVVVGGSPWSSFSVELVRSPWCKQFSGRQVYMTRDKLPTPVLSGVVNIFGSPSNLTLTGPINTTGDALCVAMYSMYPTRYDHAPRVNIIVEYQTREKNHILKWLAVGISGLALAIAADTMGIILIRLLIDAADYLTVKYRRLPKANEAIDPSESEQCNDNDSEEYNDNRCEGCEECDDSGNELATSVLEMSGTQGPDDFMIVQ